jgi:hypothetical protein
MHVSKLVGREDSHVKNILEWLGHLSRFSEMHDARYQRYNGFGIELFERTFESDKNALKVPP